MFKKIKIATILFMFCFIAISYSQNKAMSKYVQSVDNYYIDYKGKYDLIFKYFESNNSTSISQKIKDFEIEVDKLKNDFKKKRTTEYSKIEKTTSKGHSCTKGNSGGTKQCGWKCTSWPGYGFYTQQKWITKSKKGKLKWDEKKACIYLQKSGKGKVKASVSAKYKLKPNLIRSQVDEELKGLFKKIMK